MESLLPSCLANRPPFGTAANSNPRSGAAFQSLNLQGGARFSSQVWRVPLDGASIQTLASRLTSSLITVLYSISRKKNLLTCRLALGSGIQQTSKLSQQFFDGRSFRHFKSSSATLSPPVRFVERAKPK